MRITYNETADVLTLEDEAYEGYDRSVDLGTMAVDLDGDDGVLGLQVYDASERLTVEQEELEEVDSVDVTVDGAGDAIEVTATVHIGDKQVSVSAGHAGEPGKVEGRDR
ncbi:MAG: hypothetical protein SV186_00025 [Candidatus Nanohaloarchaea archaeon]|nr:hypothetical protein [Candidatus Nanohaloarchaea archaeon]